MKLTVSVILLLSSYCLVGQGFEDCKATLRNDTLILENSIISRTFLWNDGNLISIKFSNKKTGENWDLKGDVPDTYFLVPKKSRDSHLETSVVTDGLSAPHLLVNVINKMGDNPVYGGFEMKREFRIYPHCPAITYTLYLKGYAPPEWENHNNNIPDNRNLTFPKSKPENMNLEVPVLDRLAFKLPHWNYQVVELGNYTDRMNNLVQTTEYLSFIYEIRMKGNILIGKDLANGEGFFLIKESPPYQNQLSYPGCDFAALDGTVEVLGLGLEPFEIHNDEWTRCYGVVTGVYDGTEIDALLSIRDYQKQVRVHKKSDEQIMSNTWGDRSMFAKIGEKFCIEEIEAGARLGLNTFQIDAGWAPSLETLYFSKEIFPNGFAPVAKRAKDLGIEVGVWMTPGTKPLSYAKLNEKVDPMISLWKEYGIRNFKVDLVKLHRKEDELNIRSFLDSLMVRSDNGILINLDITTGNRYGFLYFNEYGNYFVENRYTDYKRYYPHWTLRNLWQLSKYVPPEKLQMEFLNIWRNDSLYNQDDPLRPSQVPFDYCFATVMAAQPLAWMEVSMLPEEAFKISGLIKKYREMSFDFHKGTILPIGEMPDGTSWTGFQSITNENEGYLLVYREYNEQEEFTLNTFIPEGSKVMLTPVLGNGSSSTVKTGKHGTIRLFLPKPFSFAMYRYIVKG